ncbi:MASE1 domain-containing protein [Methylomicrobium sp. RS1]|jgi:two-component sensor histidine kinase/integral membrane sensor domain MASE1|uniref:MASE1 domain-containing protein n=1 Tax=Candidatus Methylomicrobium oryzae TaxID=2802053 RepID=UPI001920F179|nr:MASE1 domain-containing protein [Methylomicrobium sp. RS1]MBL1262695.1 MASE1 domain-containing protein [Methylomicrobium sp. RS1]
MAKSVNTSFRFMLLVYPLQIFTLAAAYAFTGWLGLLNAIPPGYATAIWPPSGIALAALICWGFRIWPGIWLGSFLINLWISLTQSPYGVTLPTLLATVSIAVGSTLQALLGFFLLKRWLGVQRLFEQGTTIFAFTAIEALSCLVASTWGVTSLSLTGLQDWSGFFDTWSTWWLGDLIGVLIITPLIVAWDLDPQTRHWPSHPAEALVSLILLGAITLSVFIAPAFSCTPLAFVPLPCLVWFAFRFSPGGVALAALLVSGIAVYATSIGLGPFARNNTHESLWLLQAFMGLTTMTAQALAATVTGQRRAEKALRLLNAELEQRVIVRTAELQYSETQLTTSLQEKEALLKEIHHRVKNNLQIITSLLRLQSDQLKDPAARSLFLDSQRRVQSMALIHEQLYQGNELVNIDISVYIRKLVNAIRQAFRQTQSQIAVRIEVPIFTLNIDQALPLGLIVNELVSNVFKYAFPCNASRCPPGELWVKMTLEPSGCLTLEVGDSGRGLPDEINIDQPQSMGLQLVHGFVLQLHGRLTVQRHPGTLFRIVIPVKLRAVGS